PDNRGIDCSAGHVERLLQLVVAALDGVVVSLELAPLAGALPIGFGIDLVAGGELGVGSVLQKIGAGEVGFVVVHGGSSGVNRRRSRGAKWFLRRGAPRFWRTVRGSCRCEWAWTTRRSAASGSCRRGRGTPRPFRGAQPAGLLA